MLNTTRIVTIAATLMLAGGALAQTTNAPEPTTPETTAPGATTTQGAETGADALSLGKTAKSDDGIGSSYIKETDGDWQVRCVRTADGSDPCELYQLLKDDSGTPVAEVSFFGMPAGQQAAAGATIITPLETLLTRDLTLQIDSAPAKRYPFSWCNRIGCIARLGFTEAELTALKKGNKGVMSIVPVAAPDQHVTLEISLKGFTAGFATVNRLNGGKPPAAVPMPAAN